MNNEDNRALPEPAVGRSPLLPATIAPRPRVAAPPAQPAPGVVWRKWLWSFLACNPMYLLSAALLLYSLYLVSVDRSLFTGEASQLWFNLSSLQVYEALLAVTAIFLARRAVWYDSTLLVGLENLLVLVPFMLISQAALIHLSLVWGLCAAAAVLAAARMSLLKRYIASLNLPARLLVGGGILLAVNAALPVVYRMLHEGKFGTKPDWGGAYWTNQLAWWLVLPALGALALLVPLNRDAGQRWPQRRWLPLGFVLLWLAGTALHLYCLDYVYDFDLRGDLVAPGIWALAWVIAGTAARVAPGLRPAGEVALLLLPAVATLLAKSQPGKQVFLTLTMLNAGVFAGIYFRRSTPVALHLLLISLLAAFAGLPESLGRGLVTDFSREKAVGAAGAAYLLIWAGLSRDPKLGILGGLLASICVSWAVPGPEAFHWGVQAGLAFLLVHSLRWVDSGEAGTRPARWLAAAFWVAHTLVWTWGYGAGWRAGIVALPVLALYLAWRWLQGRWGPVAVLGAALLVLCSAPVHGLAVSLGSAPAGLLAALGSFLLFALGTLAALTKHHWASTSGLPDHSRKIVQ